MIGDQPHKEFFSVEEIRPASEKTKTSLRNPNYLELNIKVHVSEGEV